MIHQKKTGKILKILVFFSDSSSRNSRVFGSVLSSSIVLAKSVSIFIYHELFAKVGDDP